MFLFIQKVNAWGGKDTNFHSMTTYERPHADSKEARYLIKIFSRESSDYDPRNARNDEAQGKFIFNFSRCSLVSFEKWRREDRLTAN